MNNLINNLVYGECLNISNIYRHSGLNTIGTESVAKHSYFVSLLSDIIMQDLIKKYNIKVDKYKVLKYSIYHDFEETFTGDILTTLKDSNVEFKNILDNVSLMIFEKGLKDTFKDQEHILNDILNTHKNYEKYKYLNLENQIVKFADMLQFLIFSIQQVQLGNKHYLKMIELINYRIRRKEFNEKYFGEYIKELGKIIDKIKKDS